MFRWWTSLLIVFIGLGLFQSVLSQHHHIPITTVTTTTSRQKNTNHPYFDSSIISRITTTSSLLRSAFVSPHHYHHLHHLHHSERCNTHTRITAPKSYEMTTSLFQPKFNTKNIIMKKNKKHRILSPPLYESTSSSNQDNNNNKKDDEKFGWKQRWASIQCLVLGAIVGSIASAPISLLHNLFSNDMIISNPIAQWEYNTDSNAIIGGLFAIIYRYCIRNDDTNLQLKQGCISAMILIRTLPQIHIPSYCTSVPLNCHDHNHHDTNILLLQLLPFQYYYIFDDINVLQQFFWCGLESTILFTVVAQMMDMAMEKNYIIRFPG